MSSTEPINSRTWRNLPVKKLVSAVALALLCAVPLLAAVRKPKPVYDVKSVNVTNDGLLITVNASGDTTTPGWTNVQLVFNGMTADSVLYIFQGTPPDGVSAQVITPVKVQQTLRAYLARGRKHVVVKAATASKSASIPPPPAPK
jgi:hypothetical protein